MLLLIFRKFSFSKNIPKRAKAETTSKWSAGQLDN
jgi:hypothetical protein